MFGLMGVARTAGAGGAFSPLSLFAAGEKGAWYDPSDFASMFQDSAGTTPVTAVGQPVGKINDKSPNGNHATQPTAAARPVLRQTAGGKYYLECDGVDDALASSAIDFTATDNMSVFMGAENIGTALTDRSMLELGNNATELGTFGLFANASAVNNWGAALYGTTRTVYLMNAPVAHPAPAVLRLALNIAGASRVDELKPYINQVLAQTGPVGALNAGTGNFGNYPLYLGARTGSVNRFQGRMYGLVLLGRTATAAEVANTEAYIASKAGVTL